MFFFSDVILHLLIIPIVCLLFISINNNKKKSHNLNITITPLLVNYNIKITNK